MYFVNDLSVLHMIHFNVKWAGTMNWSNYNPVIAQRILSIGLCIFMCFCACVPPFFDLAITFNTNSEIFSPSKKYPDT